MCDAAAAAFISRNSFGANTLVAASRSITAYAPRSFLIFALLIPHETHSRSRTSSRCKSVTSYYCGINATHNGPPRATRCLNATELCYVLVLFGERKGARGKTYPPGVTKCCGGANLSLLSLFTNVVFFPRILRVTRFSIQNDSYRPHTLAQPL